MSNENHTGTTSDRPRSEIVFRSNMSKNAPKSVGFDILLDLPDELYEALGSESRRTVLRYLYENGGRSGRDELVRAVAAREFDGDERRVASSLYHVHLPKLEDFGLVKFNRDDETVALVETAD